LRQGAIRPLRRTLGNARNAFTALPVLPQTNSLSLQVFMLKHLAHQEQPSANHAHLTCPKPAASAALACLAIRGENAGSQRCPPARLPGGNQMQQAFWCLRSAQLRLHGCAPSLAASRSGQLLAQRLSPNPSVKGTSCGKPQAAPYLER
jgi:hypothetical protein